MSTRTLEAVGTRRAARAAAVRFRRRRLGAAVVVVLVVILLAVAIPRLLASSAASSAGTAPAAGGPPVIDALPVPQFRDSSAAEGAALGAAASFCEDPAVQSALDAGDDEAVVTAAGGGEAFRLAVVSGQAPCISLSDASRRWVVVDKLRPLDPIDYAPAPLVNLTAVRSLSGGNLRQDAADALTALAAGARVAGAGEVAMLSGYRSYATQQTTYGQHVSAEGQDAADLGSARPGYSEHQTGITLDLVACATSCGTLDAFGASEQGQWVAQHAWEYGFIVRYEDATTAITGYKGEPWHLRYLGPQLAAAYHNGGWHTLEEFFGLPAAPDYAD